MWLDDLTFAGCPVRGFLSQAAISWIGDRSFDQVFDRSWGNHLMGFCYMVDPAAVEVYLTTQRPAWDEYKSSMRFAWEACNAIWKACRLVGWRGSLDEKLRPDRALLVAERRAKEALNAYLTVEKPAREVLKAAILARLEGS